MIINNCFNCPFCDSKGYCNLANKNLPALPLGVYYPDWCPLLSGFVTVTLEQPKILPPEMAKEIEENIVRGLDDNS